MQGLGNAYLEAVRENTDIDPPIELPPVQSTISNGSLTRGSGFFRCSIHGDGSAILGEGFVPFGQQVRDLSRCQQRALAEFRPSVQTG